MNTLEERTLELVGKDREYLVGLRRWFHMNPEIAQEEFQTQQKIEEELDKLGISHQRIAGTGVYAEIEGTGKSAAPKTIVLRADIDALPVTEANGVSYQSLNPGKMHACGHDAHTTCLIGAARVLAACREQFAGTVRLIFQPGEEVGYGGRIIVNEGWADGADRTFGCHMASNLPVGSIAAVPGPNNASTDWFRITVNGRGAHVSTPNLGVDAAYIASSIVVSAQALITRRISPMENVLIGFGKINAGTAYNVVAPSAELEGTVRALTPELRQQAIDQLNALAKNTAESFGGTVNIEWKNYCVPLINEETSTREVQKTLTALFGAEKVVTSRQPSLGGDDMADFINRVPGCYAYVGTANPADPNTCVAQHNDHFDIDEDALTVGTCAYAAYALDFLNGEI